MRFLTTILKFSLGTLYLHTYLLVEYQLGQLSLWCPKDIPNVVGQQWSHPQHQLIQDLHRINSSSFQALGGLRPLVHFFIYR